MTHICVWKLTVIGSDNGVSSSRHQAIFLPMLRYCLLDPKAQTSMNFFLSKLIHAFQNVAFIMAAIVSRPQHVKSFLEISHIIAYPGHMVNR